jgi:hypothetical protein
MYVCMYACMYVCMMYMIPLCASTIVSAVPYEAVYHLQCQLLDAFPDAAGDGNTPRILPAIPGVYTISYTRVHTRHFTV